MTTAISVENLSKSYQLGVIGTGTFRGDLQRWWAKTRGLPDPHLKIGEADHANRTGEMLWALKDINFTVQQGEALGIMSQRRRKEHLAENTLPRDRSNVRRG
jgi:lipopolysaccharide transport system ATP-binding protein